MKLYVKTWCPWCVDAVQWLEARGYAFQQIDVLASRAEYDYMKKISGQSLTPTLELENGAVLPDFDVGQLERFLAKQGVAPPR